MSYAGINTVTTDLGLEAGAGFDLRLSRGFSLTPYADFLYGVGNGSKYGVNLSGSLLHVGLAASWR